MDYSTCFGFHVIKLFLLKPNWHAFKPLHEFTLHGAQLWVLIHNRGLDLLHHHTRDGEHCQYPSFAHAPLQFSPPQTTRPWHLWTSSPSPGLVLSRMCCQSVFGVWLLSLSRTHWVVWSGNCVSRRAGPGRTGTDLGNWLMQADKPGLWGDDMFG